MCEDSRMFQLYSVLENVYLYIIFKIILERRDIRKIWESRIGKKVSEDRRKCVLVGLLVKFFGISKIKCERKC